jgi:two-component SAPR family response regulator
MKEIRALFFPELEKQDQETHDIEHYAKSTDEPVSSTPLQITVAPSEEPELRILAFGEPRVFLKGNAITRWRVANAMELCFFLLDHERPVHKEQIFIALWPEKDDALDQALRTSLYYLRKALGESTVISRGGFYSLDLKALYNENIWYDVAAFRKYYTVAHEALTQENDTTAYTTFQSLLDLYSGDYLQPFYSNWCTLRRDELRRMYIDVRHQLALIAWRRDQFDESATHWQNILAIDNCLEEAHYGLMRCYIRQGKRGLALRQYQRCVAVLQEELAVLPGPSIQALYSRLTKNMS